MPVDDFELRWPKVGDLLFIESRWECEAPVVRDPKERFYRLPMGYKRSGDVLIDQAIADIADRFNIIYAALFCYRLSIELFLKRLIEEFSGGKVYKPKNTHELKELWERFMGIIDERSSRESDGLNVVAKLINEMHEADLKSDSFRFPSDIQGLPFVFGDKRFDRGNLREVMQGVQNFFECVYLDFSHQDDIATETMEYGY